MQYWGDVCVMCNSDEVEDMVESDSLVQITRNDTYRLIERGGE